VLEPFDQDRREVAHVGDAAPDEVTLEHRDDLVVRLTAIQQLIPPTTRAGTMISERVIGRSLRTQMSRGSLVTPRGTGAERGDSISAVRARYEAVEGGGLRRGPLRPIHSQVAGPLVDLVLDEVERA
jgi:hypothetical protein